VGYLRAGDNDVLGDIQEQDLWFAGLTVDWQVARRWSLIAQVDSHAAPTDSDITALGDDAIMAAVGVRWRFAPNWSVDASVVEDIRVETASDVVFQASLRYHPRS
jgi:long-subunit fatty acid transport protein